MKPGAVVAAIVIVGGGVLLYRWRRNARQEEQLYEERVKPLWEERKARRAAGETEADSDYIIIENKDDAEALKRMFRNGL